MGEFYGKASNPVQGIIEDQIEINDITITKPTYTISLDLEGHNPINTNGTIDLYSNIISEEKTRERFIKELVSQSRRTYEYKSYIKYLKDNFDMNKCSILKNIPEEVMGKVGIELHHFPLSMFDIASILLAESIYKADNRLTDERFSSIAIIHKIILNHWKNKIGLVPLSTTMHQSAHDGQLFIHPYSIYGDWLSFITEYKEIISKTDWLKPIQEKLTAITTSWNNLEEANIKNSNTFQIGLTYNYLIHGSENLLLEKK